MIKHIWLYVRGAVQTHPFNACTLVITFLAALFAGLSWREAAKAGVSADATSKTQIAEMKAQVEQMTAQVKQMDRTANAQENISNYYAIGRLPDLQVDSVTAKKTDRGDHTAVTFTIVNVGGSEAKDLDIAIECQLFDGHTGQGGKWSLTKRPSEGCEHQQHFSKGVIGRGDTFPYRDDFYPVISDQGALRVAATIKYHSRERSEFTLKDCYYVGWNPHLNDYRAVGCHQID